MNQTAIARDEGAFDVGPLTWVRSEIDQSLDQGVGALVAFVADPAAVTQLELARSRIHQAAGAVRMVGLEPVIVFTDEIEASLAWLESAPRSALPTMAEAVTDACTRLKLHLDELINGAAAQPLKLFPEYERLQAARGLSPSSPVDLFFPDLSVRPARPALGQQLDPAPMSALLGRARRVFQHGMLAWLRGANEGLQQMRAAVQAIEHTQSGPQRTFWWTTTALLDALLWHGLDAGYSAKQLCARIDLQIRRFIEGSNKVADRLRREVLYHVAISKPVVPVIEEVCAAWRLPELIPAASTEDLVRLQPALRGARELLGPIKDAWLRLNSGRPDARAKLEHHLCALVEKVDAIGHPDLLRLARALATELNRMPVDPIPEAAALEYATALLLLESALDNFTTLAADFARTVDAMVIRLEAGGATLEQAAVPELDDMARRAQERLLLAQVAKEIQSNLRQVEQVLDGFFRNHARRAELAGLAHPVKQIQGALRMLGLERAEQLLALCQQQVDLYAHPDTPVVDDDLELLAESLSGLGFYVEAIEQQRSDGERLIEPLLRKRTGVAEIRRERHVSLESTLEERIAALPAVVSELGGSRRSARRAELRQRLTALRHDAELTGNAALAENAAEALALVDDDTIPGRQALSAIVERIVRPAALEPAPGPSDDALRLVSVSKEKLDAELLDIYLAEATEVLDAIGDQLGRLRRTPDDRETLRTVRRGFHTLKGSGRMVGLTELGELAWAVEKVHNRWLEDDRPASTSLLALIDIAQQSFRCWINALQSDGEVTVDASALAAAVARVDGELADARAASAAPEAVASGELADAVDLSVDRSLSTELPVSEADEVAGHVVALAHPADAATARPVGQTATGSGSALTLTPGADAERGTFDSTVTVRVGDVTMSAALHQILCEEAQQHVQVLRRELESLQADSQAVPADAMVRASHTLRGIHRSSGIAPVADTAGAFEQCLVALQRSGTRRPDDALAVLAAALDVLSMLLARVRQAEGFPASELHAAAAAVTRLDSLRRLPGLTGPGGEPGVAVSGDAVASPVDASVLDALSFAGPLDPASTSNAPIEIGQMPEDVHDEIDPDLLGIFLEEAQVLVPQAGDELREWQRNSADPEAANRLRRTLHTVKGSARMAGALRLGELTHLMESRLLAGDSLVTPTTELFEMLDIDLDRIAWLLEQLQRGAYDVPLPWIEAAVRSPIPSANEPEARMQPQSLDHGDAASDAGQFARDAANDDRGGAAEAGSVIDATQPVLPVGPAGAAGGLGSATADLGDAAAEADRSPNHAGSPAVMDADPRPGCVPSEAPQREAASADASPLAAAEAEAGSFDATSPDAISLEGASPEAVQARARSAERSSVETAIPGATPAGSPPEAATAAAMPAGAFDATSGAACDPTSDTTSGPACDPTSDTTSDAIGDVTSDPTDTASDATSGTTTDTASDPASGTTTDTAADATGVSPGGSLPDLCASVTGDPGATGVPQALDRPTSAGQPIATASADGPTVVEPAPDAAAAEPERAPDGVRALAGEGDVPTSAAVEAAMPIVVAPITRVHLHAASSGHVRTGAIADAATKSGDSSLESETRERAMLRVRADMVDRLVNEAGEVSIARARVEAELRALKSDLIELTGSVLRLRSQVRELEMHAETQIQSGMTQAHESAGQFDPLEFDRFTRFQELTRSLVEGINDVSSVQQALLKHLDDADAALVAQGRMSREVQQALFSIRTMPFASLGDRLHRVVRQTARELGKRASLEIRGGHVELDRSVLEKLVGPLEHLVRNAIDHGIESREKRRAAGKAESGQLVIDLRQQGNEVVIALDDDGAGIDFDRIRDRALALGVVAEGSECSRAQLVDLMFSAGFTTARSVTKISGRGIGLDVVRSDLAALGGRIEVTSEFGAGTKFTLVMPLTLAVAQVAIVRVADRLYALPSPMVEHVQQMEHGELIELYVAGRMSWQARSCPFYNLGRLLGDPEHTPEADRYNAVLLVRSGANVAAIHVDQMVGNQEVVVKNIGPQLSRVAGVTGATVLGTGEVVLIINPVQLALRYEALAVPAGEPAKSGPLPQQKANGQTVRVLVVDDSLTVRKITSRFLSREGFEVLAARDGIEALQVLADTRPEVILLDIEMPRMDGFEFAKAVRGDARHAGIPIVMITSRTADKHRLHARELGVDHYLGKPYQEDELLATLRALLAPAAAVAA